MFGTDGSVSSAPPLAWIVVLSVATVAAVWDLRTQRIPNLLTVPVLAAGLVWSAANGGASGFLAALGNCLLLALPCLILFFFANGGAGDVKLLAAMGSWLGYHDVVIALVCVAAAGIICGLLTALVRRRMADVFENLHRMVGGFAFAISSRRMRDSAVLMPVEQKMLPMPFGVAIALGIWVAATGRWLGQW